MPAEDCDGDECFINPSTHGIAVGSETTISGAEGGAIPWVVAIRRRGSEKELLGEKRILRSFHDACKMHRTRINTKDEVRPGYSCDLDAWFLCYLCANQTICRDSSGITDGNCGISMLEFSDQLWPTLVMYSIVSL